MIPTQESHAAENAEILDQQDEANLMQVDDPGQAKADLTIVAEPQVVNYYPPQTSGQ